MTASATSASSRVTSRIGSRPRMSRDAIRTHSLLRKLERIGVKSSAPRHSSTSSPLIAVAGCERSTTSESINSSIIPGLLIRIPERNWLVEQSSGRRVAASAD